MGLLNAQHGEIKINSTKYRRAAASGARPRAAAAATLAAAKEIALTTDPAGAKGLLQMYDKKVARFDSEILKQHPNRIGVDYGSGELMIGGKRIANSNFADLKRELYIHNKNHYLTGLDALTSTLTSLLPTFLSRDYIKCTMYINFFHV